MLLVFNCRLACIKLLVMGLEGMQSHRFSFLHTHSQRRKQALSHTSWLIHGWRVASWAHLILVHFDMWHGSVQVKVKWIGMFAGQPGGQSTGLSAAHLALSSYIKPCSISGYTCTLKKHNMLYRKTAYISDACRVILFIFIFHLFHLFIQGQCTTQVLCQS